MLDKIKGIRTYAMLVLIAVLGVMVDLQNSCTQNPAELGALCQYVQHPFVGKAIIGLSAVAAWFRKLANSGK